MMVGGTADKLKSLWILLYNIMHSKFLLKGMLFEMGPGKKKSYVRLKVWPAILVTNFGFIYVFFSYIAADYRIEQMSLMPIGVFFLAMAAGFYLHNIKCERCKTEWYKTGHETYADATSMLDFARRFLTERSFWVHKRCKVCGLERY
jgi:hypothetical protein